MSRSQLSLIEESAPCSRLEETARTLKLQQLLTLQHRSLRHRNGGRIRPPEMLSSNLPQMGSARKALDMAQIMLATWKRLVNW